MLCCVDKLHSTLCGGDRASYTIYFGAYTFTRLCADIQKTEQNIYMHYSETELTDSAEFWLTCDRFIGADCANSVWISDSRLISLEQRDVVSAPQRSIIRAVQSVLEYFLEILLYIYSVSDYIILERGVRARVAVSSVHFVRGMCMVWFRFSVFRSKFGGFSADLRLFFSRCDKYVRDNEIVW